MAERDLSLSPRAESVRDIRPTVLVIHFSLEEIKNHFYESLNSIKAQYNVAESLMKSGDEQGCKMIWRSQVVLAEGLLDYFIHEISKYCLYQMFIGEWEKTEKYCNFMVPMSKVEKAIDAADSGEWFFEYINTRFSRDVFMSSESMNDQLNLIGIGYVKTMVKAFPRDKEETSKRDGTKIVQELFKRRNEIAHQNDRNHANNYQNDISKEFVDDYIDKIERIVNAIWEIANSK